jgi:hypothetical protein
MASGLKSDHAFSIATFGNSNQSQISADETASEPAQDPPRNCYGATSGRVLKPMGHNHGREVSAQLELSKPGPQTILNNH